MAKIYVNPTIQQQICNKHGDGITINKLVKEFGLDRRIITRILADNGIAIRSRSEIVRSQAPILEDKSALEDLYINKKMSMEDIADHIGVGAQIVKTVFKDFGIAGIPASERMRKVYKIPELADRDYMYEEYVIKKRSLRSFQLQFKISDRAVRTALNYHGIPIRKAAEQPSVKRLSPEQQNNAALAGALRSSIAVAIRNNQQKGRIIDLLGCSMPYFKAYIEAQFLPGMTWDNYGEFWQLKILKTFRLFDLTNPEQEKQACHYTNFTPSLKKHNKRNAT